MTADEREAFMAPTRDKYEDEGNPYYSTAPSGTTASSIRSTRAPPLALASALP